MIILESVDSICRDSADTQYNYDNTEKIPQNLKYGKHISLHNNIPFIFECLMTNKVSQWHKKAS